MGLIEVVNVLREEKILKSLENKEKVVRILIFNKIRYCMFVGKRLDIGNWEFIYGCGY